MNLEIPKTSVFPDLQEHLYFDDDQNRTYIQPNPEVMETDSTSKFVNYIHGIDDVRIFHRNDKGILKIKDHALYKLFRNIQTIRNLNKTYECLEVQIFLNAFDTVMPKHLKDDDHELWQKHYSESIQTTKTSRKSIALLLNDLCKEIKFLTSQKEYKQQVQNRKDKSKNQYQRSLSLINELFIKHSKVLIMRTDFAFKATSQVDIEEMKEHMSKFLKYLLTRKGELQDILGYIWKLEFGVQKGYHYHCMFFMDGNKYANDSYYAQKLGELWQHITQGHGIYHNCNASKFKYRKLAIGCISHDDEQARETLNLVLKYIAKVDQFLMEKTLIKYHTFGRSSRKQQKSQRGRKRLTSSEKCQRE